jgi:hypothetical protein
MKTFELVKSRLESLDRKVNSLKEIEAAFPVMKRQRVNDELVWILQNPETKKWAVISEDQVNELNDLYMLKKYGVKVEDNPFILKA